MTQEGKKVENSSEIINSIKEVNNQLSSFEVDGSTDLSFLGGSALLGAEYSVQLQKEPRLSSEINAQYYKVNSSERVPFFAYIHHGYFLEHREGKWHRDQMSVLEEWLTGMVNQLICNDQLFIEAYLDVFETDKEYIVRTKEDMNINQFYVDVLSIIDIQAIENVFQRSSENQKALIGLLLEEERIKEAVRTHQFEASYDKNSYQLATQYLSFKLSTEGIHEYLGRSAEEVPEFLLFVTENKFTQHNVGFDFSKLDEVAPAN